MSSGEQHQFWTGRRRLVRLRPRVTRIGMPRSILLFAGRYGRPHARLLETFDIARQRDPGVLRLLPDRIGRGGEFRVCEGADGDAVMRGPKIHGPADRRAALRTETV